MRDAPPTWHEVLLAGVLPTLAALVVAAIFSIERLQLDWSVLPTSGGGIGALVTWFACIFIFAVGHIAGSTWLNTKSYSGTEVAKRVAKTAAFIALHFIFQFGAYIIAIGILVGVICFLAGSIVVYLALFVADKAVVIEAATYISILVFVIVCPACCGLAFGIALGTAASPPRQSLTRSERIAFVRSYVLGSIAAAIVTLGLSVSVDTIFLHRFGVALTLANAGSSLLVVALACCFIWLAALQVYWRSGRILSSPQCRYGLMTIAIAVLILIVPVQVMVSREMTIFGPTGNRPNAILSFIRSGYPLVREPILIGDSEYIGPRELIKLRRSGEESSIQFQSPDWLRSRRAFAIEIVSTDATRPPSPDCQRISPTRTFCTDLGKARDAATRGGFTIRGKEPTRWHRFEAYELDDLVPEAIAHFGLILPQGSPFTLETMATSEREWCSLKLRKFPDVSLTTQTTIDYANGWPADALQLKSLVKSWFKTN